MDEKECGTCGYPKLRLLAHAVWCKSIEELPDEDKNKATYEIAEQKGLVIRT